MLSIDEFRAQYPGPQTGMIHLNNAGQTPLCGPAARAMAHWADVLHRKAAHGFFELLAAAERARGDLAALLGARPAEVSFYPGTAAAVSQVAFGLGLRAGDEVLLWDQEYPSSFYPWLEATKRAGAKLVVVPSGPDLTTPTALLEKQITPRTRAIAFSWVQYRTGAITRLQEVAALARPRGIFTCADVIQGAGLYPVDFAASGIDAICGGSHKWLTAAHGAGYLLLREEHHARFTPVAVGAMTYGTPDTPLSTAPVIQPGPARFEPGGKAFVEIICLGEAARLLAAVGVANLTAESARLGELLIAGLRERGYALNSPHAGPHPGGIVNFSPTPAARWRTLEEVQSALVSLGASFALRPPGVRLSPHAFNTAAEIASVLQVL